MFMPYSYLQGGGVSVDTAGWKSSLVARNGFAQSNILQSACQEPHGSNPAKHRLYSELPDTAGPSSSETAAEVASWLCQQQLLSGGAFGQSTSWGPQGLQPFSLEDVSMSNSQHTRSVPKTNPQYSVQQHSPVCKDSSLACGQAASSAAQSHGTHAATTLTTNLQLQPAYSDQSGFLSAGNVMSPAAFVHNAQQMLWQQQQQMQQYQQQQLLLGYQQYSDAMHKQQQQRQKKQDDSSALTATAVVADLASSMACTGPSAQEAVTPLPNSIESTCDTVRDALGDRAFFSIRSLLLMQQETFVQQLSELHHLVRVQQMVSSELASEHHTFTQQYRTQAMTLLQSSQGAHGGKRAAVRSASGQVALAVTDMAKQPAPAVLGGERPVWADDGGAAASAALPVHAVLMRSLPCSVRAAVSAPQVQDCSALNPASYYIGRHVGMLRPVAVKAASKMKGKGISGSEAAVVATAGLTVSDGATVQRDATAAATGNTQHRQQQHLSSLMLGDNHTRQQVLTFAGQHQHGTCSTGRLSVGELDRPPFPAGADAHKSSTARKAVMPRVAGDKGINRQQWQQQQAMPPPPPMRPELAAQHAAAAAASHQQQLQLHQQQEAEGQVAAAAGPAGASALNVFRPMPQIDPSFASKFLAGGQRDAAAVAAPAPQFDPHSYWMSKHYGGRSASQSMSAPSPVGAASGRKQQQDALNNTQLPPTVATQYKQQQRSYNTFVTAMADTSAHASVASGNQPVLHWWQDAAATFGDVGLLDPNAPAPGGEAQQESQGWRDGQRYGASSKRLGSQYQLQQLPHKKRVKLSGAAEDAAAAVGAGPGACSPHSNHQEAARMMQYGMGEAGDGHMLQDVGAFKPVVRRAPSKQRSRVRSNRMGSSCQGESVCSDNSASSIDNPNMSAAAAAVRAGSRVDLGPDADGVSLLLHIGQHADKPVRASASSARSAAVMCIDSGAAGSAANMHSNDKSAAALLLSLSGSMG